MSAEEEYAFPEGLEGGAVRPVFDPFDNIKRAASIVGDLRVALRDEGFTKEETFELVQAYWASELGVFE
ncbi:hypothetical protein ACFYQA_22460 [Streptomyces sp. NPDC005774]|uniref:DUF7187 family protein n=1 Tax=Streptomyces sp. NPDC005774 TaxID=3364728 RepID=UPI0036760307